MRASPERAERRRRWIVRIGVWVLRVLGATWRIRRVHGERYDTALRSGEGVIFALWHGHMLPLLYQHRGEGVAVLISEHNDGEIIARVAERLGFRTIRGSTSRGASRALIAMARHVEAGGAVAITPDGPRGPARSFAPGALVAAQRAGATVLPIAVAAPRAWRLRSWDSFLIPKPFSRVTLAYGDAVPPHGSSPREAAEDTPRFEQLMAQVEREASLG